MKSDCNPIEMGIIPEGCSVTPALLDTCGNEFARHFSHCKSESFLEIDRQLEPDPEAGKSKLIAQCSKWENSIQMIVKNSIRLFAFVSVPINSEAKIGIERKLEIPGREVFKYSRLNVSFCVVTMPDGNILRFSDPKDDDNPNIER